LALGGDIEANDGLDWKDREGDSSQIAAPTFFSNEGTRDACRKRRSRHERYLE